ncbi:MAG: Mrp/NBP35 family ATP-binding protein [Candidatus Latescibacterota bacterium]|nr:Mrp/NBP35 family ATP-binding protein [Candidatus Latescibacterota bacterium]
MSLVDDARNKNDLPRTMYAEGMLANVRNVVAVGSCKGGVGKSTVCVHLAASLANSGYKVGLLDADMFGPSIPLMTGVHDQSVFSEGEKLVPVNACGISLMSMGFVAGRNAPVMWRGPLLAQALRQFLDQVAWGELDFLFIDLPPGTGDIPLSLCQTIALSGAIIVTTPQNVAIEDVNRGISMFKKVEVEILGIIENMSYYDCQKCTKRHQIFGDGGARFVSERFGLNFHGEIPLSLSLRRAGDEGRPLVGGEDEGQIFRCLAEKLVKSLWSVVA